jgi:Na+-translocating ferredoxin:NAD+ oxidoreductase RnfC subunit
LKVVIEEDVVVKRGQLLAKGEGERSVPTYSAIEGRVTEISDKRIKIERGTSA